MRTTTAGAVALGLILLPPAVVAQTAEPSAAELFTFYQQRQFDSFEQALVRVQDFAALRKQIEREGRGWPLEAKAAFLLETADAALRDRPLEKRSGPEVDLFEDACKAVRQLPPQGSFEAAWHLTAFSVLSSRYGSVLSVADHLKHIRGRFDEGRIALMRAMPDLRAAWTEATQVQPTLSGPAANEMWFTQRMRSGRAGMRDAVKQLEAARRFDSVRPEATLRQAALLAIWDLHDEALPLLAAVPSLSDEPWLRYMAALLTGRSLEAMGRANDARVAYRSAVDLEANGKAARLALASMLFGAGQREEADKLVTEALSERSGPPDPWKEFLLFDLRFLEARRTAMREQLR